MTTCGVPSPTSIHFTIDGRHGTLEAKHIAEALQIPFEPVDPSVFRQWSPLSQRDMLAGYFAPPGALPMVAPLDELLIETIPPVPMPEAVSAAPPMTSIVPPIAPTTFKPFITISASKFRGIHLSLLPPPQPDLPESSKPLAPTEDTIPLEDTSTAEDETQIVDTVTATPEDTSFPPEGIIT
ncbi:hypothetical protein AAG906_005998 [Vitis piasezkii]